MILKINKDSFKNILGQNTTMKLFSIIFALLLFSYVRNEVDPETTETLKGIPVRYDNVLYLKDNDLVLMSPNELTVNVTLKGKTSDMRNIRKEAIVAYVDFKNTKAGEQKIPIFINVLDKGIRAEKFEPDSAIFKIDEKINKNMEVTINTVGSLAKDYVLGKMSTEMEVEVTGAKSVIDTIDKLVCNVNISGISETTILTEKVMVYNKNQEEVDDVTINPEKIEVGIPVLKTETVPIKVRPFGNSDRVSESQIVVDPNAVLIKGNSAVINKVREISTVPFNIKDLEKGPISIKLDLPEGVSLVDATNNFVIKIASDENTNN